MSEITIPKASLSKVSIGIDPGNSSGAVAWIKTYTDGTRSYGAMNFSKYTSKEISDNLVLLKNCNVPIRAIVEKVSAMPGQGVTSMFSFGQNYGWCQGVLMALNIPYDLMAPIKWQGSFVTSAGGKKILNSKTKKEIGWDLMTGHEQSETKKRYQAHNTKLKAEHKKKLKEVAERIFPNIKVINQTADALLLAEACDKPR